MSLTNPTRREFAINHVFAPASSGQLAQTGSLHVYYSNAKDAILEAVDLMDHDGRIVYAEVIDVATDRCIAEFNTPWRDVDHCEIRQPFEHPDRAKRIPSDAVTDIVPRQPWFPYRARCEAIDPRTLTTCGAQASVLVEVQGRSLTSSEPVTLQRFRCLGCYKPDTDRRVAQV
jgi:hypothetical protein